MLELEEEVNEAIEAFLAAIMAAAEHAAIAALRDACSSVGDARATGKQVGPRAAHAHRRETPPPTTHAPRRAPTPADAAMLTARIVACVGSHPGSTVAQLAPYAGVHATTLRRHLHRLAHDGLIRIEERPSFLFGGQPTRAYFGIERADVAPTEPGVLHAEPVVPHAEAA